MKTNVNKWNPNTSSCNLSYLLSDKDARNKSWKEKNVPLTNGPGKTGCPHVRD